MLPIKPSTAELLQSWFGDKLPGAMAFNMPGVDRLSEMSKRDLRAADIDPSDTGDGKLTFHGLRHSFGTGTNDLPVATDSVSSNSLKSGAVSGAISDAVERTSADLGGQDGSKKQETPANDKTSIKADKADKAGFSTGNGDKTERMRRDSNPRNLSVQRFSRPSRSTTLPLIQIDVD